MEEPPRRTNESTQYLLRQRLWSGSLSFPHSIGQSNTKPNQRQRSVVTTAQEAIVRVRCANSPEESRAGTKNSFYHRWAIASGNNFLGHLIGNSYMVHWYFMLTMELLDCASWFIWVWENSKAVFIILLELVIKSFNYFPLISPTVAWKLDFFLCCFLLPFSASINILILTQSWGTEERAIRGEGWCLGGWLHPLSDGNSESPLLQHQHALPGYKSKQCWETKGSCVAKNATSFPPK